MKEQLEMLPETKKPRKPRKTSRFLVLRLSPIGSAEGESTSYDVVAEAKSVEGCRNQIKEKKIAGNLMIVCVHRTLDVQIKTIETLTGI